MTDNLKKYNEVFCNIFEVREDDLENMKLKESANWDSVGHINLISSLEETFGKFLNHLKNIHLNIL